MIGSFLTALFVVFMLVGTRSCGQAPPLRVGTYNVQEFGPGTDLNSLLSILSALQGDVIAMQEIQDLDLLHSVAGKLSAHQDRRYQAIASRCGGKSKMHVGFLYDAARLRLEQTREFPELRDDEGGQCSTGARAGLLATFSIRRGLSRQRYSFLVVHFPAMGTKERAQERRLFWQRALAIARQLRDGGEDRVVVLGDVNSTGYLDNAHNERAAIDTAVKQAGFRMLTPKLGCTAYYQPGDSGPYIASHLDHIVASPAVTAEREPQTTSFCATLRCASVDTMPADYYSVSDHCPVSIDLR